jgi:hypothetical protein
LITRGYRAIMDDNLFTVRNPLHYPIFATPVACALFGVIICWLE